MVSCFKEISITDTNEPSVALVYTLTRKLKASTQSSSHVLAYNNSGVLNRSLHQLEVTIAIMVMALLAAFKGELLWNFE